LGNRLQQYIETLPELGKRFIQGLADGIRNATGLLYEAVSNMVLGMIAKIQEMLGIQSPSRVGIGIGRNFVGSVGLGGLNELPDLERAFSLVAQRMTSALSGAAVPGLGGSVTDRSQHDSFQFFAPVVIQGETPSGSLGAKLKGRRY
jgi:hypothetical protein